jgi:hypothetical protein
MRAVVVSSVVLVLVGAPSIANAGGPDPAAAEALFREGREAAKRGDAAAACGHFAESQRLDPAPGTLLNIADCEEKLGKIASAWAHLREALDALPPNDDRVATAAKHAAELEPRLPRLVVRLANGAPKDARVERDGAEVGAGSLGVPIPIDPGSHRVIVKAAGRRARAYAVDAAETKRVEVLVDAGEIDPSVVPPTRTAEGGAGNRRTFGYVLLGAGGLALGAGAVTGLLAIDRNAAMKGHCDAARTCDQEGLDAARAGRTFDLVSTVSFLAAGALIASGIVWLVTHPSTEAP